MQRKNVCVNVESIYRNGYETIEDDVLKYIVHQFRILFGYVRNKYFFRCIACGGGFGKKDKS